MTPGEVGGSRPPGVPPQPAGYGSPAPREARGVAFFVAVFLGILLIASAGLNVLLLLLSVGSIAGSGLGGVAAQGNYAETRLAGSAGAAAKIFNVPIRGAITEAENPMLGSRGGIVTEVEKRLRWAAEDPDVRGIVLDINSPGGGVTDSDKIYTAIRRFRIDHPEKKVVALFGDMAASGGYYVAAAAERIVARRTTITGSIGVIMSGYNFGRAADEFGIEAMTIKSERTPYKDILSPMRPMRDDERVLLTGIVDELLDQFIDIVDIGRDNMDRAQVLAVANGAIFSASQALQSGLVDEIGDRESVLAWLEDELDSDVQLIEHRRVVGLADVLLGVEAAEPSLEQSAGQLLRGLSGPRFLYFWEGGR